MTIWLTYCSDAGHCKIYSFVERPYDILFFISWNLSAKLL